MTVEPGVRARHDDAVSGAIDGARQVYDADDGAGGAHLDQPDGCILRARPRRDAGGDRDRARPGRHVDSPGATRALLRLHGSPVEAHVDACHPRVARGRRDERHRLSGGAAVPRHAQGAGPVGARQPAGVVGAVERRVRRRARAEVERGERVGGRRCRLDARGAGDAADAASCVTAGEVEVVRADARGRGVIGGEGRPEGPSDDLAVVVRAASHVVGDPPVGTARDERAPRADADAGERQRRLRTAEDGDRSARSRRCGGQVEDVVARGAAAVDAMGAHSVGVCQGCDVRLRR